MPWNERIATLIADRDELTLPELSELFGFSAQHDGVAVNECLSVFEEEYGVPGGVLRPGDTLEMFIEPPAPRGLLEWLFDRAAIEDKASELSHRLKSQRERMGRTPLPVHPPTTVGEYVRSWLGQD